MIKLMIAGRRAPGRTRAAAQHHLLRRHGRMVVLPPADAGAMPAGYIQNHVIDGAYPASTSAHGLERDLLTELWFDDMTHLQASVATPYYREHLRPDEPRFVDDATVAKMMVAPAVRRDGPRRHRKIAWLLSHAPDRQAVLADAVLALPGDGRMVVNTVLAAPDDRRFVDSIIELWHDEPASLAAEDVWPFAADADRARSFTLVLEEYTSDRIRALLDQSAQ